MVLILNVLIAIDYLKNVIKYSCFITYKNIIRYNYSIAHRQHHQISPIMTGFLCVKFIDGTETKEPVSVDFEFGFDCMMHNLVVMDEGEWWGNISSYGYEHYDDDGEPEKQEDELKCHEIIKAFGGNNSGREDFQSSMSKLSSIEDLQNLINQICSDEKRTPEIYNQNLVYYTSIQADDTELFLLCTYHCEDFLRGMARAVELHKFNRLTWGKIIDTSDQQVWKHLPFQF